MSEFRAPQIIYVSVSQSNEKEDGTFDLEDDWTCCEDIDDAREHFNADLARESHFAGAICVVIASDVYDQGSTGVPLLRALDDPETRLIDAVKASVSMVGEKYLPDDSDDVA